MTRSSWTVRRTSNPSELPVSVAELKDHLNLAQTDISQDSKLEILIGAATERVEKDTGGRQIITATYVYNACEFGDSVLLPIRPISSVTSVAYLDADGISQALNPADWVFDASRREVRPAVGKEFPTVYDDPSAVTVEFSAGYGTDGDCIPRLLKAAIMLCAANWFYDPAQEASALHSQESPYNNIIRLLMSTEVPDA